METKTDAVKLEQKYDTGLFRRPRKPKEIINFVGILNLRRCDRLASREGEISRYNISAKRINFNLRCFSFSGENIRRARMIKNEKRIRND